MSAPTRSGNLVRVGARLAINVADTAHPNATNPSASAIRPSVRTRSRDAWVSVSTSADETGVSVTVTLFGSATGADGSWRVIGQLNGGAAITETNPASGVTDSDRVAFTQAFPGLLASQYIWPTITGTLAIDEVSNPDVGYTDIEILGEAA